MLHSNIFLTDTDTLSTRSIFMHFGLPSTWKHHFIPSKMIIYENCDPSGDLLKLCIGVCVCTLENVTPATNNAALTSHVLYVLVLWRWNMCCEDVAGFNVCTVSFGSFVSWIFVVLYSSVIFRNIPSPRFWLGLLFTTQTFKLLIGQHFYTVRL